MFCCTGRLADRVHASAWFHGICHARWHGPARAWSDHASVPYRLVPCTDHNRSVGARHRRAASVLRHQLRSTHKPRELHPSVHFLLHNTWIVVFENFYILTFNYITVSDEVVVSVVRGSPSTLWLKLTRGRWRISRSFTILLLRKCPTMWLTSSEVAAHSTL